MDSELTQLVTAILFEHYPDCRISINRKGEIILRKRLVNRFVISEWVDGSVDVERREFNYMGIGGVIIAISEAFLRDNSLDESIPATINEALGNMTPESREHYMGVLDRWKSRNNFHRMTSHWKIAANITAVVIFFFILSFLPGYNYYSYSGSIDSDIFEEKQDGEKRLVVRKNDGKIIVPESDFTYMLSDSLMVAKIDGRQYVYDAYGNRVLDFSQPGIAIGVPLNPKCSKLSFYPDGMSDEEAYEYDELYVALGNRLFRLAPGSSLLDGGISDGLIEIDGHIYHNDGTKAFSEELKSERVVRRSCLAYIITTLLLINLGMFIFRRRMRC